MKSLREISWAEQEEARHRHCSQRFMQSLHNLDQSYRRERFKEFWWAWFMGAAFGASAVIAWNLR